MALFISYSSRDAVIVGELASALRRGGHELWIDDELGGGDAWWRAILGQIRDCDIFLAAISQNMLQSKACQAEISYALALGKPILPVQVGPLDSMRTNPLAGMQVIDFQQRSIDSWMALDEAVRAKQSAPPPLPDPLPDEPPMPFGYLMRLGGQIRASELSPQQQTVIVAELEAALTDDGDDDGVRRDICALLRQLRDRSDVTYRTRTEVDSVLAQHDPAVSSSAGPVAPVSAAVPRPGPSRRPLVIGLVAGAVAVCIAAVVAVLLLGRGSSTDNSADAARPGTVPPPASSVGGTVTEAVADNVVTGAGCAAVDAPLSRIPTDANEPVLQIPQPSGWERNAWMESDGIFRFALYNNAVMRDGVAASALVTLDEERGLTDADSIFMLKRGALSAIGATDITTEKHTVCGQPAETVRYQTGEIAGLASHPATVLLVVLQGSDRTFTASLTMESADPDNGTFQRDAATMLAGFQMLPPGTS